MTPSIQSYFRSLLFAAIAFVSSNALALFDAQLAVGSRKASIDGDSSTASEIQLSLHLSPIPLLPVAGGFYLLKHDYSDDDLTGTQLGLEVMAWLPFDIANLTVFGKLGIGLNGAYKVKDLDFGDGVPVDVTQKVSSAQKMSVGVKWSPLVLVSLLAQLDYFSEKWTPDFDLNGSNLKPDDSALKVSGTSFLVGVEVGI